MKTITNVASLSALNLEVTFYQQISGKNSEGKANKKLPKIYYSVSILNNSFRYP